MSIGLHICFWVLCVLAVYSYFIYPLVLFFLPSRRVDGVVYTRSERPSISVIVAAHNEGKRIKHKLDNLLSLDRYSGDIEWIVASDASTDRTDDVVEDYAVHGFKLLRLPSRGGKEAAQALAVSQAKGDILVFTDVSTMMEGDVLERIGDHFASPMIGAISSTDRFVEKNGKPAGEGAYVRYEMWLRRQESRVSSLIGLSGSFFAARTSICRDNWSTTVPSDFMTAINCIKKGLVAQIADDVIGYYPDIADSTQEYKRKVRTVLRGMHALANAPEVLNMRRFGLFSFQIWSHKILRWGVPWILIALLVTNIALLGEGAIYVASLVAQVSLYSVALLGSIVPSVTKVAIIRVPAYFVIANLAVLHAGVYFMRGKTIVSWKPSAR